MLPGEGASRVLALETKPTHAEGRVTGHDRHSGQDAERAEGVERTSGKRVPIYVHTLYQPPDDDALRQPGDERACGEHDVPPSARSPTVVTKLERHAPEREREQHDDDRDVERRKENAVREGKSREERHTRHDQPRFITIPGRGDRIDHPVAHPLIPLREQQRADAEIESVEDDVDREGEQHEESRLQWEIHVATPGRPDTAAHLRSPDEGHASASPRVTREPAGSPARGG